MSFGSGGGFGGFGSNNQQQSTFGGGGGGFGSTNTNTGFGANANTNTTFGQSNTAAPLFGGSSNTTSSPFGGGGFGSNTNTSFGSKPFGAGTTGTGGIFGGGATTGASSGFGGFGANTNTASTGFGGGAASSGGGLFGANKTGFGASATGTNTGTSLFGGGSTGGGFGAPAATTGFGASAGGFGASASGAGTQPQPNNGTASVPFSAYQEKDAGGNQQFQTITFQQPYQGYSLEELRLVDYNQGRRYGNQNGQAGAFGQNTGFGGFGATTSTPAFGASNTTNTGGGLFGANTNTTSSFGQNTATPAFGSSTNTTGGGLFGQNKPAGGGLFGSGAAAQPATGGGLFGGGSNTNTGGAFGAPAATGTTGFGASTSGGGLFGAQNQTQAKPAFGGFGAATNTTTPAFGGGASTGGFGSTNTGGGLFGQNQASSTPAFGAAQPAANTAGSLFGGASNTGGAGGGLFGQPQQNQAQAQPSGGGLFSGFGANNQQVQQKPGGLFGASTTNTTGSGGLFGGQAAQPQQTGGLFGQAQPQQNQGGLFGSKPATTGTGLFGNSTQNTANTGGGLFGATNTNTQNQGSSLFGQQNQPKPGGLFGSSTTNTNTGSGLFGGLGQNNNASTQGSSLFSGQNQQQNSQQPMNNSLFGASGSSLLQTSMNTNPYGNDALFANLQTPTASPGPLATPLSSSQKNRKSAILPQHKLNPSASTRLLTPQNKRAGGGYGFTYSTYGTPNSASSLSSPGLGSSLFGNSNFNRSLGKSLSTSNLRNSYTPETSIFAPGAFSTTGRGFGGSGNLKKLNINRAINTRISSLFDDDTSATEKKKVSFDETSTANGGGSPNGTDSNAVVVRIADISHEDVASSSSSSTLGGGAANGTSDRPEMTQVTEQELTPVPENGALAPRTSSSLNKQPVGAGDPTPGQYYSIPSMDTLRKMSRSELASVQNFVVGRERIGKIEFHPGNAVDITGVDLDKLFDDIVQLSVRNATVYGSQCSVPKPARGTGLNQPSRITLANSWPRNRAGKKDQKHIERLKHVHNTTYVDYIAASGEWIFTVPHFSSYGLDYEGDQYSDDEDEEEESSELSPPPDTPAQLHLRTSQMTSTPQQDSPTSRSQSSPDDTFDFKKRSSKRASIPGNFGNQAAYEEDVETMETTGGESFLGERSVGSLDSQHDSDYSQESESGLDEDQDMAGPVSAPVHTTEHPTAQNNMPKSILKNSQVLLRGFGTPSKGAVVFDDDWANQLQRTISPKKQDRHALRETQGDVLREQDRNTKLWQSTNGQDIFTRMGMMESLFGETDTSHAVEAKRKENGFQYPYPKRPKDAKDLEELSADDKAFHACNKPHFSETGTFVYANKGSRSLEDGLYHSVQQPIVVANQDIRFTKLPTFEDAVSETLIKQKSQTMVELEHAVPYAKLKPDYPLDFAELARAVSIDTPAGVHEHQAWQLLSLLFDEEDDVPSDMTKQHFADHKDRYRKDKLSAFWESLVSQDAEKHAQQALSAEERALAYLSGHNIADACRSLLTGLDLRLATMVAQIGGDHAIREAMTTQIEDWRHLDVLSEMDDSVRAIYELISGNCTRSVGKPLEGRENRAETFGISQRFGLDWRRAFGLRLWYGTLIDEPIELAVAQFADALRDNGEAVKPTPWFVEQKVDMGWNDPETDQREDLLWGILKLYASSKMDIPANVEDVLSPESVSGHPLNARLSFQLFHLFKSRQDYEQSVDRKVGMPTVRDVASRRQNLMSSTTSSDEQTETPLIDLGDKLTLTHAASLHTAEHWTTAIFVYAHLSSPAMREHYIHSLLAQYSKTFTLSNSDNTYNYLVRELLVPTEWLHAAAALQAKFDGDDRSQTTHLIKAGELEEAHEVLCRSVAPESIISRDYDALRELLGDFLQTPANSPTDTSTSTRDHRKEPVPGWKRGGQIYYDYIQLLDLTKNMSSHNPNKDLVKEFHDSLKSLQNGLEAIAKDKWTGCGLEERVALTEIAGAVADMVIKNKPTERASILQVPLTEDLWLRHSMDMSLHYYRTVMAK